jgi:hypothetical protein
VWVAGTRGGREFEGEDVVIFVAELERSFAGCFVITS